MYCSTSKTKIVEIKEPIQFIIGDGQANTPIAGTNEYVNEDLEFDKYLVERAGAGILHKNTHYTRRGDGGFKLMGVDVFAPGECFTLMPY